MKKFRNAFKASVEKCDFKRAEKILALGLDLRVFIRNYSDFLMDKERSFVVVSHEHEKLVMSFLENHIGRELRVSSITYPGRYVIFLHEVSIWSLSLA